MRYGYTFLDRKEAFMYRLVDTLIDSMGEAYPELPAQRELIMRVIKEQQPKIASQEFDNLCTMVFAIREGRAAELIEKLKKAGGSVPEEQ